MDPSRANPRVLIVDDDADHRELMRETLEIYYQDGGRNDIVTAGSAAECLAQDLPGFDVILLDYHLPDMGGLALLDHILAVCDVPVIFVTSENNTARAAEAIEAGAQDYLIKMGDYLFAIPAIVRKALLQHSIRKENQMLQKKLEETCEQLRIKNFQLEESLEKVKEMASTDHLTGLANRRTFAEVLNRTFSEAVRYGYDLTCCMCDLDHYKQLNDTLGHQMGDEILQMAAAIIRESLRTSDIAARFGGDEMVLLLPHTSLDRGTAVAQRIREQLAERTRAHPVLHHEVTMSMGVASLDNDHPTSAEALVSMADRALYLAKSQGKNRIASFGEAHV